MRQFMSEKKVKKLALKLNLPIKYVLVRGGSDHRKDLCLHNGDVLFLYKTGTIEKSIYCHRYGDLYRKPAQ